MPAAPLTTQPNRFAANFAASALGSDFLLRSGTRAQNPDMQDLPRMASPYTAADWIDLLWNAKTIDLSFDLTYNTGAAGSITLSDTRNGIALGGGWTIEDRTGEGGSLTETETPGIYTRQQLLEPDTDASGGEGDRPRWFYRHDIFDNLTGGANSARLTVDLQLWLIYSTVAPGHAAYAAGGVTTPHVWPAFELNIEGVSDPDASPAGDDFELSYVGSAGTDGWTLVDRGSDVSLFGASHHFLREDPGGTSAALTNLDITATIASRWGSW